MEKQKMSWKEIMNIMHPQRNQNNVIEFPTSENKEFKDQKKDLVVLALKMEKLMNEKIWDIAPISAHDTELLAQFGEGLTFKPLTAQRLIACLSAELIKYRLQKDEPYNE